MIASANDLAVSSPDVLTLGEGLRGSLPVSFAHDFSRSEIGKGKGQFVAARKAMENWEPFNLGWVQVANLCPPIARGELVAVEARTAFLWSINLSRITDVVDGENRFGFLYTTTAQHVEEGQERFVVEFEPDSGSVFYLIEAISRPRHWLARMGYGFSRAMQHRFARDSHRHMKACASD